MDEQVPIQTGGTQRAAKPHVRRRVLALLVPLLLLGSVLWVSNWFYQRSRLFTGNDVVLGDPFLPWGKLIPEDTARELFGVPVSLRLKRTRLTPYQIRLIGSYTPLNGLQVQGLTDADMLRLSGLVNLEHLSLDDSPITDAGCDVLGRMTKLRYLQISSTAGTGITDRGLEALSNLDEVRHLSLHAHQVTDIGLETLGGLKALQVLYLIGCQIRGDELHELCRLTGLETLSLANCPLEGDCLGQLAGCVSLRHLYLDGSPVTDAMAQSLIPVKSLQSVDFDRTRVSREGRSRLEEARPGLQIYGTNRG